MRTALEKKVHIQHTELGLLGKSYRERGRLCFILSLFFRLCHVACGILVSRPGIKPVPPALEVQSPNHWDVPGLYFNMKTSNTMITTKKLTLF